MSAHLNLDCAFDPDLIAAIAHADRIRREHNGIGGVYLYLGHDGGNSCELKDIDGRAVAKADSGRSLLQAVAKCEWNWRTSKIRQDPREAIDLAVLRYAFASMFNTVGFIAVVRERYGIELPEDDADQILSKQLNLVRLHPGCVWLKLPKNHERHI